MCKAVYNLTVACCIIGDVRNVAIIIGEKSRMILIGITTVSCNKSYLFGL